MDFVNASPELRSAVHGEISTQMARALVRHRANLNHQNQVRHILRGNGFGDASLIALEEQAVHEASHMIRAERVQRVIRRVVLAAVLVTGGMVTGVAATELVDPPKFFRWSR